MRLDPPDQPPADDARPYARRDRETNVLLIKSLIAARDEQEHAAALEGIRRSLHPAVFSELDQFETAKGSASAAGFVDHVFLALVPDLLALHRWPDGLDDASLLADVAGNIDFARYCLDPEAGVRERLPPAQVGRLEDALRRAGEAGFQPRRHPARRTSILDAMAGATSVHEIAFEVVRLVDTAVRRMLDHPPSRLRTLRWLRARQDRRVGWVEPGDNVAGYLESLRNALDALAREAVQHRLGALLETVEILQDVAREWTADPARLNTGETHARIGSGPCGRCAMHFLSVCHPVIDARTPGVTIRADGHLTVSRPLNLATCPFCGWSARLLTPMVAALPQRGKVIVCIPTRSGEYEADIVAHLAPAVRELMDRAREGLDANGQAALDAAPVLETFSPPQFFYALHTGTTAPEHHVFLVLNTADGSRMICDPTKNYMGVLASDDPVVHAPTGLPELPDEPVLSAALGAFNRGETGLAQEGLRRILAGDPANVRARYYLAVVLRASGQEAEARRILYETGPTHE